MKKGKIKLKVVVITLMLLAIQNNFAQEKQYEADWESLRTHVVPTWAQDVKFGIYAHWGVYSVTGNWDYKKSNWGNYYITAYKGFYPTTKPGAHAYTFKIIPNENLMNFDRV